MMAMADYRLCDVCGCKAFYDANLNYDDDGNLDYVGEMLVICTDCSKTHECKLIEKNTRAQASAPEGEAVAEVDGYRLGGSAVLTWLSKPVPVGTKLYTRSNAKAGEVAVVAWVHPEELERLNDTGEETIYRDQLHDNFIPLFAQSNVETPKVDFEKVLTEALVKWGDVNPTEIRRSFVEHMAGAVNAALFLSRLPPTHDKTKA